MIAAPLVMGSPTAARPSGCSRRLRPGGRNCRHRAGAGSVQGYHLAAVQLDCGMGCSNRAGFGSGARVKMCTCSSLMDTHMGMGARLRVTSHAGTELPGWSSGCAVSCRRAEEAQTQLHKTCCGSSA